MHADFPPNDLDVPRLVAAERVVAVRGGGYFPVLVLLADGSLGAVVRGGAPHIGLGGRLDWIRSTDGGRTWSLPTILVDSEWDDRNPALGQMDDGTIVCAYAEASTYNAAGQFDTTVGKYECFYVLSSDSGASWSVKQKPPVGPVVNGSPFGRIITLSDGTALMPLYGGAAPGWTGDPPIAADADALSTVLRSHDNGRTWGEQSVIATTGHNETSLLALSDALVLAEVRTQPAGAVDQFVSEDGGHTWGAPLTVTAPSQHPPDICRLQGGRLLLVHGNRREPLGVGAVLSPDNGHTWDYAHRVMLGWDSLSGDCGYPSVVQLPDGTVVVMYYSVGTQGEGPDEMALVVRFTEAQLLAAAGL